MRAIANTPLRLPCRMGLGLLIAIVALPPATAAETDALSPEGQVFKIHPASEGAIQIDCDGELFTRYQFRGAPWPILYPLIGPTGVAMTRHYPLRTDVPGEPTDHPNHQSIWFAHGSVNGVNFWAVGDGMGTVEHDRILETSDGPTATLTATHRWMAPSGEVVCRDVTRLRFSATASARLIDYEITLQAGPSGLEMGDTKEGTMALRLHPRLQLIPDAKGKAAGANGRAVNSEGVAGAAVWGKPARWVDYSGEVDGQVVGIAMFDHPANPRHPTTWMARDYGLFAANPFGLHEFEGGAPGAGAMQIEPDESVTFRYLLVFHTGDAATGSIEELYRQWAKASD